MAQSADLLRKLTLDKESRSGTIRRLPGSLAIVLLIFLSSVIWAGFSLFAGFQNKEPSSVSSSDGNSGTKPNTQQAKQYGEQSPSPATSSNTDQTSPSSDSGDVILNASGYITPRRLATVSAEITGRIVEVLVEEGDRVEKNQILARVDDTIAAVNYRLARSESDVRYADRMVIEAELAEAKRILGRTQKLRQDDFSSEAQLTGAQSRVQSLDAQLIRSKALEKVALLEAERRKEIVDDHVIRAPFSGVIIDKNAQPGEIIAPGSAGGGFTRTGICTLVDMTSLEIEVDVNESYIARVKPGQKVRANLDAYPDWNIKATVTAVIPTANRDKATVRVRVGLDDQDDRILPDMGVKVAFLKEQVKS